MVAQHTILVVDGDPAIRDMMADILCDEGYIVRTAANGIAALVTWCVNPPALAIVDSDLTDMSALDMIGMAYAKGLATIPVLLMTVRHPLELRQEIGAFEGYLFKPFDLDALLTAVASCLDIWRSDPQRTWADPCLEAMVEA